MNKNQTIAIILAAGMGTRMKSDLPKVLHPLAGRPMINHLISKLDDLGISNICTVVSPGMEDVVKAVAPHSTAIQDKALGTAHAVLAARETISDPICDVLILFGADPLISSETLSHMLDRRSAGDNPAVVVLGFRPLVPGRYGRLIINEQQMLENIVEVDDATPEQLEIPLCNAGFMVIDGTKIWSLLERINNDNVKNEYYLTNIIALARADGDTCAYVEGNPDELHGVDSRSDLAIAEALVQQQLRQSAMDRGVTLIDPDTVFLSYDTILGRDIVIEPNVYFGPKVSIGDGAIIKAFCHLEHTKIGAKTTIGPFARLRGKTELNEGVRIGNFVELKNADIGLNAKVSHLSYIGDASIGDKVNIGAGTITCNYDGFNKYRTTIGNGAFIGSNSALIAPIHIGSGSVIGAGSTISKNISTDTLAITRAKQKTITGWPSKFRNRNTKEKN